MTPSQIPRVEKEAVHDTSLTPAARQHKAGPVARALWAACQSDQHTCGAVLMPVGHTLESEVYCNVALTCAALIESTLYGVSISALNLPLVDFNKGLCSVCGVAGVSAADRKEQKCRGNVLKNCDAYPVCNACAEQGFKFMPVRKTKAQASMKVRATKRARPATAAAPAGSGIEQ